MLLKKISWAGGNCPSYEQAARTLEIIADLRIDPCQIARITQRIGNELSSFQNHKQKHQEPLSDNDDSNRAAVISVDGGRVQTRAQEQGRGVHQPQWKESKVAHLQVIEARVQEDDPHPDVPRTFTDQRHVQALVTKLNANARTTQENTENPAENRKTINPKKDTVLVKSCLATIASSEEFAPLVRNEAERLKMDKYSNKAFLGDGAPSNWLIHEKFFPLWFPVLDFVHLVEHIFLASTAACKDAQKAWLFYLELINLAWKGNPQKMIDRLKNQLAVTKNTEKKNDPYHILKKTIGYIETNKKRMDYPNMRKRGLPISSCRVESLIKQINMRVKASDKFWIIPNLKAVLQIRAAELSTTNRWNQFWYLKRAA